MWSKVARQLNLDFHKSEVRAGKQCKKRWVQVLQPLLKIVGKKEKEQVLQENQKKQGLKIKFSQEECQKKLKGISNHQMKQKLDSPQVEMEKDKIKEEIIQVGIKKKCDSKDDLKVTKKPKLNDSSIKNLCRSLMESQ